METDEEDVDKIIQRCTQEIIILDDNLRYKLKDYEMETGLCIALFIVHILIVLMFLFIRTHIPSAIAASIVGLAILAGRLGVEINIRRKVKKFNELKRQLDQHGIILWRVPKENRIIHQPDNGIHVGKENIWPQANVLEPMKDLSFEEYLDQITNY